MPDIAMCKGEGCLQKNDCYRYRAIPSEYQSYFRIPPYEHETCVFFAHISPGDKLVDLQILVC